MSEHGLFLEFALLATGTILAMTGIAASAMARLDRRPEWHWLATFAYLWATTPWLAMVALASGYSHPMRDLIGSICQVVAGVALLEFARQKGERLGGQRTGRWVHLVVLGAAVPFAYSISMDPLRAAGTLATLVGGVAAAVTILRGHHLEPRLEMLTLRRAKAVTLALFGIVASLDALVSHAQEGISRDGGLVWLSCLATVLLAASTGVLYSIVQYNRLPRLERQPWLGRAVAGLLTLGAIIATAWGAATWLAMPVLPVLLITLLVILLLLVSFHSQERIRDQVGQVAQSEQRARLLVDSAPNATLLFDDRGRCILVNRAARLIFGFTEVDALERPFVYFWPDGSKATVNDAVQVAIGGTPARFDAEYHHRDGRRITVSVAMSPAVDADGKVQGFVAVAADVTLRRRNERALVDAKNAAEAATQAKTEFLAVMSHEIRTPLGGTISLLEALKKMPQPPHQRRQTELALDSAESLLEILDHIIDAARIEASQFSLDPKPFNPATELSRGSEGQRIRAEAAGLTFNTHFSTELPRSLLGDGTRLRQVLGNLVTNAIKFTRAGQVNVKVGGEMHPGRAYLLRIEVSDTGLGIRPEVQARLFSRHSSGDIANSRHFGSTGLGLAIVRTIVDLMGGEIRVASEPEKGTTITVEVILPLVEAATTSQSRPPLEAAATAPPPPANEPPSGSTSPTSEALSDVGSLKILCAEDNPTNRLIIQLLLEPMGHEVHFAEEGRQAVQRLSLERFDVVLMDNRMPIMDGFQATRAIRDVNSPVLDHDVPVIALTANASKHYRDECIASGMNDYLTKPVREPALKAALARAVRGRTKVNRSVSPPAASATRPPLPPPGFLAPATPPTPPTKHQNFTESPPLPPTEAASVPEGLSEEDLLKLLDEAEQTSTPSDPASQLTPDARLKISRQYLQETPRLLNSMRVAWAVRDAVTLGRAGHSLKSSSRYVRADRLCDLGKQIESLADRGDLQEVAPLIEQSDREFTYVSERLLVETQS